jgi:hypothetical protein
LSTSFTASIASLFPLTSIAGGDTDWRREHRCVILLLELPERRS